MKKLLKNQITYRFDESKNERHEKDISLNAGNGDVRVDGCEVACFRYDSTACSIHRRVS